MEQQQVASVMLDNLAAGGASQSPPLEQQTDLVIKSHELIKRKFFEQLERRASIKNSIKSTKPRVSLNQSLRVGCLEAELEALAREVAAAQQTGPTGEPLERRTEGKTNSQQATQEVARESASLERPGAKQSPPPPLPERDVSQADLVILPTKYVNERRLNSANSQQQNLQATGVGQRDGRLPRARRQSRRQPPPATCHCCCSSSSSASSASELRVAELLADSLSEELESLVSRSDEEPTLGRRACRANKTDFERRAQVSRRLSAGGNPPSRRQRIDIDCVSPRAPDGSSANNRARIIERSPVAHLLGKPGKGKGMKCVQQSSPATPSTNSSSGAGDSAPIYAKAEPALYDQPRRLRSDKTLIGHSHARCKGASERSTSLDENGSNGRASSPLEKRSSRQTGKLTKAQAHQHQLDHEPAHYESLQPLAAGYSRLQYEDDHHQDHNSKSYSSLNLYQSLWRTYAKRRHRNCQQVAASSRRAQTRCGQLQCRSSSSSGCSADPEGSAKSRSAGVWGQLTKINKSDGSQVVELRRCPQQPWGFFVARGALDNSRGIFISRWHDDHSRSALSGLLTIGDRLLAIDQLTVDPDCDILRVNQLISKKSKILLKVKPFRG